ncbi:hypothetical protein Scep_022378 [Stephania cephalantha]|uniref:Uncharacterized protein n=1 Tax=Stephania cephalantha TaxID=152367 RepID=A0AAP0FHB8_9MAGN
MRELDEVLEKLRSKYFERISRGEGSAHDSLIIKEMLPPDVRVARDAQDLLVECCVGKEDIRYKIFNVQLLWTVTLIV